MSKLKSDIELYRINMISKTENTTLPHLTTTTSSTTTASATTASFSPSTLPTDTHTNGKNTQQIAPQKLIVKYRHSYYDITRFLKNHPGGINTLRDLNNGDMTKRFMHAPPHSDAAMYLMREYEIKPHRRRQHIKVQADDGDSDDQQQQQPPTVKGIELITDETHEDKNNNQLDDSMEYLVDWSRAMVPQIPRITQNYDEWVHKPVDRPLRLFGPWYLEMCTKTPWWVIPLFWIPVITHCLWAAIVPQWQTTSTSQLSQFAAYFVLGIIFWTWLEYMLHRYVFHMKVTSDTHPWLCTLHFMIHGLHHKVPFDAKRLVFPPVPGVIIATMIYMPLSWILPQPRILLAGALFGYLCYDLMHYYLHYGNPSLQNTSFMYNMKRYHYQHHFAHQNMGYGISSPLWDIVFNTRIHLRKLRFQLRWK